MFEIARPPVYLARELAISLPFGAHNFPAPAWCLSSMAVEFVARAPVEQLSRRALNFDIAIGRLAIVRWQVVVQGVFS